MTEEIREKIADAQMVLVGIGKELEERFHGMEQDAGYVRLRAQAHEENRGMFWSSISGSPG